MAPDVPDVTELERVERAMEALAARRQHLTREAEEARAAMGNRAYKVTLIRAAFSWLKERLLTDMALRTSEEEREAWGGPLFNPLQEAEAFMDWLRKGAPRGEG